MAYNAVSQHEIISPIDSVSNYSNSPPLPEDDLNTPGLFLETPKNYSGSAGMQDSVASRSTYDMLDDRESQSSPAQEKAEENELHITKKRDNGDNANSQDAIVAHQPTRPATPQERTGSMRSTSLRSVAVPLRHPTPDLSMPGAMVGNVEHLENTAERLSMTSDMGLEIQKMSLEQKRSDSRRSSLLTFGEPAPVNKQFPSNSIVEINNAARSGGYSPGGFMISPRSSFSNRRSASKGSRYSSRPEPEHEGRPLESFASSMHTLSPVDSRASSFAEGAEMSTMARALAGADFTSKPTSPVTEEGEPNFLAEDDSERPTTSASQTTIEQAQKMFQDFDGVHSHHFVSRSRATSDVIVGGLEDGGGLGQNFLQGLAMPGNHPRFEVEGERQELSGIDARISSAPITTRPQSYANPKTGQEMVYYPAPVPAVLNLPQKLSQRPSPLGKDRRKSQVLSNVPEVAPESETLLSDNTENDVDSIARKSDNTDNSKKTAPQQRRVSLGGRILTQDSGPSPRPPLYRPIASFSHPSIDKRIPGRSKPAGKDQSAVATLDRILDASANAPVNAFVDHAIAGESGSEIYAKSKTGTDKQPKSPDLTDEKKLKRRGSFGQWLARASGLEYDPNTITTDLSEIDIRKAKEKEMEKERRRSEAGIPDRTKSGREDDDSHEGTPLRPMGIDPGDEEGQFRGEVYLGPPNTLLAELQLRKQHAKQRTRPITSVYPNGLHSTLIELDTVAEAEKRARERKRVTLGWEDHSYQAVDDDDDDDVPLGVLYPGQKISQPRSRPVGLLERRELEDNEPLSNRRERMRPVSVAHSRRPSSMLDMPLPGEDPKKRESFLASSRPVSGDFASELMSQFGGDLLGDESETKDKGKGKAVDYDGDAAGLVPEEEETLAQRKKRLRAEREAREAEVGPGLALRGATPYVAPAQEPRPQLRQRRSMADILSVHPAAGRTSPGPQLVAKRSSSYSLGGGLLGLHDQEAKRRSSALSIDMIKATPKPPGTQRQPNRASSMTMAGMGPNMGGMGMMAGGAMPYGAAPAYGMYNANVPQFASPTMGAAFPGNNFAQMNLIQQQQYMMAAGYGNYQPNFAYGGQMPYGGMGMGMMPAGYNAQTGVAMGMGMGGQMNGMGMQQMPLSQGQLDMVERWRQGILQ